MTLSVLIGRKDFSGYWSFPSLEFNVRNLRYSFLGGCLSAEIEVSGSEFALWNLLEKLRCPIEVEKDGEKLWWGFINAVSIGVGSVTVGASLDKMYNAVRIAYTSGTKRLNTDWTTDAVSISEFGRKEILLAENEITDAEANTLAYTRLQIYKYPQVSVRFGNRFSGAVIYCSGWLSTLDWRYYFNDTGKEGYEDTSSGGREIGEDDRPQAAMTFQLASATSWDATKVRIRPWKYPSSNPPTDDLLVELCSDNNGQPGTVLASATYPASEIKTTSDWMEKALSTSVSLQTNTMYWLKIRRSGSVNATKYFMVDTNLDCGYPRGNFFLYFTSGSVWKQQDHKGHLNFLVLGDISISEQINYLVTNYAQFLSGVIYLPDVSTETNPFRNGDTRALEELKKLLKLGSSSSRRLTCWVDANRRLIIDYEPEKVLFYGVDQEGHFYNPYGSKIDRIPVGVWCRLRDVVPNQIGESALFDMQSFFVEETEWRDGKWYITRTRDERSEFDFGGILT